VGATTAFNAAAAVAKPLYSQVRDLLLVRIKSGEWAAGEALPNEFVLASNFGVSIGTVRRAIEGLEDLGIVVRKQGRGTYVAGAGPQALVDKFAPLRNSDGSRADLTYQLVSIATRSGSDVERARLGLPEAGHVFEIVQLVALEQRIVGREVSIVSAHRFPRLGTQLTYGQHLYSVFSDYSVLITKADDCIAVAFADDVIAPLINADAGSPMLTLDRVAYTFEDQPVELRHCAFAIAQLSYRATIV
jgi:GntR family transcriptional regulator